MTSVALRLRDVRVQVRGRTILDGLGLDVAPGECRALVGLNGAGKTTALRVALGMLRPTSGTVEVLGQDVGSPRREVWRRVGHLVETPFCYPELTARENARWSASLHEADSRRAATETDRLAEVLGLTPWLDTPVRRLSLGTRQKVGLVAALVHEPDVVVLDEPTNGLDPLAVVAFRDELDAVTARGGAVLVTSHHFDELARVAGAVDVLHHGTVVGSLRPAGGDLERVFFDTILAAERDRQESA